MPTPSPGLKLILDLLARFDLTQVFKTKGRRGDLLRWSAKRTIGGLVAATACQDILINGMSWPGVAMAAVGILPLCLSFAEKRLD